MPFTRIITIPRTIDSMHNMQKNCSYEEDQLNFHLDYQEFYDLWNNKVFDKINEVCDSLIDDFEEEMITDLELIQASIEELSIMQFETDFSSNLHFALPNKKIAR